MDILKVESYAASSEQEAADFLAGEVDCVSIAARLAVSRGANPVRPYVLSVGATPTAHAISKFKQSDLPGVLEL
jgi:D-serine deaminase-like pyridoxal phosphate-dependent protein